MKQGGLLVVLIMRKCMTLTFLFEILPVSRSIKIGDGRGCRKVL
jgi:hypothetical protein